ncbi:MAG: 3-keto-5-aminohexanoate cleavage protein [Mesorhizobium sp.]|nr:3-keto-5-aminohexanoate cleavage protein [Mesorhizobium sp.]
MNGDLRHQPKPLIVNLAPTGMVPTRRMSPFVPLTPEEIVDDVAACAGIGITIAHVHARDAEGNPTPDPRVYAEIIGSLRRRLPDLLICASCSGRGGIGLDDRAAVLDLPGDQRPDMASLTLSSLNFAATASVNDPDTVVALAGRMRDRGIVPELEVFDLGMANMVGVLAARGLIRPPFLVNVLVGNVATAQARLLEIAAVLAALPDGAIVTLAGLGSAQLPVAAIAAASADGVRIGLEDNLWLDHARESPARNGDLVARVGAIAEALGRPVMTPAALRALLGL